MRVAAPPPNDSWPLFDDLSATGHENVVYSFDEQTGLKTIIAIHSTALGPSLGGARFYPYQTERLALKDVLRLSEGMSLKAAAADLALGGGKAVIIGDPTTVKTDDLLRAYASVVDRLGGSYITAEDVGTTVEDMQVVRERTRWVSGLSHELGGSGDPSPLTAHGVLAAMRAAASTLLGQTELSGLRVVIQGVGKVGSELARLLVACGAHVVVSDVSEVAVDTLVSQLGVERVDSSEVLGAECDIFAPCAMGAVLSSDTIPHLSCKAVVGSANNQLACDTDAELLASRDILYVPDFVANAGGIINISVELRPEGYDAEEAARRVDRVFDTTVGLLEDAADSGRTPWSTAVTRAEARIAQATRYIGEGA